jgi:hypothetical protein
MAECVSASINTFSADHAAPPIEALHHCSRAKGILAEIQPAEDCQIARLVNRFGERRIVQPSGLDLSRYIGQEVVVMGLDDGSKIRRAGECIEPQ